MKRNSTKDVRRELAALWAGGYFVEVQGNVTGNRVVEIVGASFIADEESIFGEVSADYVARELEWYKSQSLNVWDIPGGPPSIWKQVADADGFINSNYGWCIYSWENYSQLDHVIRELDKSPLSRRAVTIYTRPSMWEDYNRNHRQDFMCTNAVQYLIRDGYVEAVVQMRSNDAVFGYKNDRYWQKWVLNEVVRQLRDLGHDVLPGRIHWNVGSLHVYERHFPLIEQWAKDNP